MDSNQATSLFSPNIHAAKAGRPQHKSIIQKIKTDALIKELQSRGKYTGGRLDSNSAQKESKPFTFGYHRKVQNDSEAYTVSTASQLPHHLTSQKQYSEFSGEIFYSKADNQSSNRQESRLTGRSEVNTILEQREDFSKGEEIELEEKPAKNNAHKRKNANINLTSEEESKDGTQELKRNNFLVGEDREFLELPQNLFAHDFDTDSKRIICDLEDMRLIDESQEDGLDQNCYSNNRIKLSQLDLRNLTKINQKSKNMIIANLNESNLTGIESHSMMSKVKVISPQKIKFVNSKVVTAASNKPPIQKRIPKAPSDYSMDPTPTSLNIAERQRSNSRNKRRIIISSDNSSQMNSNPQLSQQQQVASCQQNSSVPSPLAFVQKSASTQVQTTKSKVQCYNQALKMMAEPLSTRTAVTAQKINSMGAYRDNNHELSFGVEANRVYAEQANNKTAMMNYSCFLQNDISQKFQGSKKQVSPQEEQVIPQLSQQMISELQHSILKRKNSLKQSVTPLMNSSKGQLLSSQAVAGERMSPAQGVRQQLKAMQGQLATGEVFNAGNSRNFLYKRALSTNKCANFASNF